jgi:hypothetical protein
VPNSLLNILLNSLLIQHYPHTTTKIYSYYITPIIIITITIIIPIIIIIKYERYSNTGEPKVIVKEFIEEVCTTMHWITDEALKAPAGNGENNSKERKEYLDEFMGKVRNEENKVRRSIMSTFNLTEVKQQKYNNVADQPTYNNDAGPGGLERNLEVEEMERALPTENKALLSFTASKSWPFSNGHVRLTVEQLSV